MAHLLSRSGTPKAKKMKERDWLACSYRSETMRKQKLLPERKNKKPIRLLFFCFLNQEENEDSGRWRNLSIICLFFLVLFELVLNKTYTCHLAMGMNSAVLEMIWIARQLFWKTDTDLTAFWCSFAERVISTCQLLPVDGIFLTFSNKI